MKSKLVKTMLAGFLLGSGAKDEAEKGDEETSPPAIDVEPTTVRPWTHHALDLWGLPLGW